VITPTPREYEMARQREPAALTSSALRNGKQLGALMLAPVIGAPLTWRIGMTAPAIERAGAVSIQMDMPARAG
jgi:hypothetical protein